MGNKIFGRGQKFEVCTTPQNEDLDASEFGALTYVNVCCIQNMPEFSSETNLISETCISGEKIRGVGADTDSSFEVAWFVDESCVGQDALVSLGSAKSSTAYAVRKVYNNAIPGVTTPSYIYARVIFTGYKNGGVGIDDTQPSSAMGSLVQGPLVVKSAAI